VPDGFGGVADSVKSEKPTDGLAAEAPPTVTSTAMATASVASSFLIDRLSVRWSPGRTERYPVSQVSKRG
jgi:hypothetical protein